MWNGIVREEYHEFLRLQLAISRLPRERLHIIADRDKPLQLDHKLHAINATKETFACALNTIGVISPASVDTATDTSTLLFCRMNVSIQKEFACKQSFMRTSRT
jgi:hypothetical protein